MRKLIISATILSLAGCATTDQGTTSGASGASGAASGSSGASSSAASAADECGGASYYADSLAGNSTASGEPYRPSSFTAAHKTLPFGTELRVVRRDTGEAVDVTVNDRGPFVAGRIVDLSRAAAEAIDLTTAGVADVCITVK